MNRRIFLAAMASAAAPVRALPPQSKDPFDLGVASGDPTANGVVLWTRLTPETGAGNLRVTWEAAEDEQFRKIAKKGRTVATPGLGHSVHVEVNGLQPDRWYWYRFRIGPHESPVGRTRTMPSAGSLPEKFRFTFASCQHFEQGYFTAYQHMAEENPDLVVHLGDYIYEGPPRPNLVRRHNSPEIVTLSDYRNRYALYRSDEHLRRMHALAPWIVTWDDHELDNNYAGDIPEDKQTRAEFLERRANAYQAYYEHTPLRRASIPSGSRMRLYRRVSFGGLAEFFVLDSRQYRTDQPCGDGNKEQCPAALDESATILGMDQERWLTGGLADSRARWNVLAQQVMVAKVDRKSGPGEQYSMDQWSGYEAARRRLTGFLGDRKPSNPVVLTGDIHTNWCNDLKAGGFGENDAVVASEFVGTSISSGGDGSDAPGDWESTLAENPHVKFHNRRRGYVRCDVTPGQWRTDYRTVEYVARLGAPVATRASFVLENGRLGVQKA